LNNYKSDILKGFEQLTIDMPNDYEGKVACTLVRKLNNQPTEQAVLYIHGFLDYFFQEEMADKFLNQRYNFYALDLRKCGRSILPNQKPYNLRKIDEYFADLDASIAQIKSEGNKKLVVLAHSTGGLTTSLYLNKHKNTCEALVLNSPFLEMNKSWIIRKIGIPFVTLFTQLLPNAAINSKFSSFYGESLHKAAKGEWDYNLEWKPIAAKMVTLSWLNGIHKAHKAVKRGLNIEYPVLVLSSDKSMKGHEWTDAFHNADLVLSVKKIQHYADKLGKSVTKQKIVNGKHDLVLSEKPIRDKVYETIFSWLNKIHLSSLRT
jgi:alpha-beta hydrolase superfamily lysophospholipase